jgi:hypothetical protein
LMTQYHLYSDGVIRKVGINSFETQMCRYVIGEFELALFIQEH